MSRLLCVIYVCALLLASCRQIDVGEKNLFIPAGEWRAADSLRGSINITDTAAVYDVSLVLRHRDDYRYNNIWLQVGLQAPGEAMEYRRLNVQLGTDATGWLGAGMNNIWESRHLISVNKKFAHRGPFAFSVKQIMRDEPLSGVLNAGLSIQKKPGD